MFLLFRKFSFTNLLCGEKDAVIGATFYVTYYAFPRITENVHILTQHFIYVHVHKLICLCNIHHCDVK